MARESLTPYRSLNRAVEVLEEAFEVCKFTKDAEGMLSIAAGFVEIYERLKYVDEDEDELENRPRVGFAPFGSNNE